ncbi:MAG: acetyl-CoA carboxylase carboxyltransferase subunit alpha [Bacillota bacterium]|nr:acetyl-CoA carboxylase carboxyltransferase subunit alpha [Bacillota bacterium]
MSIQELEERLIQLQEKLAQPGISSDERYMAEKEIYKLQKELYSNLTPWDRLTIARANDRPKAQDYIAHLFDDFIEFHGDRRFGDDAAIIGGIAYFEGKPVTVLAESKGKSLEENMKKNFGMVSPEGYRKVLRLAKQAEKFHRPIITFVDTAGAYPGKGAEERGQAQAIAECLYTFSDLKVPVICVVISEGGSGGALALSVADRIVMLENAVYSILSPEGFASILWKDETRAQEAASVMKMTSFDLHEKGIVDKIIKEPLGGAQKFLPGVIESLRSYLKEELEALSKKKPDSLVESRYQKFRKMGVPSWKM